MNDDRHTPADAPVGAAAHAVTNETVAAAADGTAAAGHGVTDAAGADALTTVGARQVGSTRHADADAATSGAVWRLTEPTRGLDANVISLPPHDAIDEHDGPGLDVLVHVLEGDGEVRRGDDVDPVPLTAGDLVWLPGDARRGFVAGAAGLRYFSVHARKPGMRIGRRPGA